MLTSVIVAAVSCEDNLKNQDETDVDCGGTKCPKCNNNKGLQAKQRLYKLSMQKQYMCS